MRVIWARLCTQTQGYDMGYGYSIMKLGMPMLATTSPYRWRYACHAVSVNPTLTTAHMDSQWLVDDIHYGMVNVQMIFDDQLWTVNDDSGATHG